MERKIEPLRPYRHFKGRLYYVHSVGEHSETGEVMVTYQALYPPYKKNRFKKSFAVIFKERKTLLIFSAPHCRFFRDGTDSLLRCPQPQRP